MRRNVDSIKFKFTDLDPFWISRQMGNSLGLDENNDQLFTNLLEVSLNEFNEFILPAIRSQELRLSRNNSRLF